MRADPALKREVKSLQEELSASKRARSAAASASGPSPATASAAPSERGTDEQQVRDQINELVNEVSGFLGRAEAKMAAHRIESIAGALLVGILIGRLLGRR